MEGHMKPLAAAKATSRSILLILGSHLDFLGLCINDTRVGRA
jgi:hypothetical protein